MRCLFDLSAMGQLKSQDLKLFLLKVFFYLFDFFPAYFFPSVEKDECKAEEHACEHLCVNELGGFRCECKIGFELQSDGKSCESEFFSPLAVYRYNFDFADACGFVTNATSGVIQSPNYPDLYPRGKACVWQIEGQKNYKISINFTHFDLEGNGVSFVCTLIF